MSLKDLFSVGLTVIVLSLLPNAPARAQAIFVDADATINTDVSNRDVFVGKDQATFTTQPGTITLTVAGGAVITGLGGVYPDGGTYQGVNVFGAHHLDVTGGSVFLVTGLDNSVITISGGNVTTVGAFANSTTRVNGGTINFVYAYNGGTNIITSGTIGDIDNVNDSVSDIFGGTITNMLNSQQNGVFNLYGTGLALSSGVPGNSGGGNYTEYVLSGTLQNGQSVNGLIFRDYDGGFQVLDSNNPNGASSPINFFAGSVAAPEPGVLPLLMTGALPLVGVALRRRIR